MPQPQLTLNLQQYEALVYLARIGARLKGFLDAIAKDARFRQLLEAAVHYAGQDANRARDLEAFLKSIEEPNGIHRYFLAVRWQELAAPLPPRVAGAATRFPENWPPNLQGIIELMTRPIARADVDAFLLANAKSPVTVVVTADPGLTVGWTAVEDYFV
jgi:hypothetical protein